MFTDKLLQLPRRTCINFHDGPLPQYAGTNVTSWALIGGEKLHGVTWHQMEKEADVGDIFESEPVSVTPRETAYSLNMKCFEAGLTSFERLLQMLQGKRPWRVVKQDLTRRTYFAFNQPPPSNAIIDAHAHTSTYIDRLVRALDMGPSTNNTLGVPRFIYGGRLWMARYSNLNPNVGSMGLSAPGSVLKFDLESKAITFIAADQKCLQLSGIEPLSNTQGWCAHGRSATAGCGIEPFAPDPLACCDLPTSINRSSESFWRRRLSTIEPLELPEGILIPATNLQHPAMLTKSTVLKYQSQLTSGADSFQKYAVAAVLGACARLNTSADEYFDVAFRQGGHHRADLLYATYVPFRAKPGVHCSTSWEQFAGLCEDEVNSIHYRGRYLLDLPYRTPGCDPHRCLALTVGLELDAEKFSSTDESEGFILLFRVLTSEKRVELVFSETSLRSECAESILTMVQYILESSKSLNNKSAIRLSDMPVFPESVSQKMINMNEPNTSSSFLSSSTFPEIFYKLTVNNSSSAVEFLNVAVSYEQLAAMSRILAVKLMDAGATPGSVVGVMLERGIFSIVSILSIWKVGAIYAPLDPQYPTEHLETILDTANPAVIITTDHLENHLPAHDASVLTVDIEGSYSPKIECIESDKSYFNPDPDDIAYVMFTSGSTGKPKGVSVTHKSLLNLLHSFSRHLSVSKSDVLCAVTSPCFDISMLEFLLPLLCGAKVLVASRAQCTDGHLLGGLMKAKHPTLMQATPSTWRMLIEGGWSGSDTLTCLCGGEALPSDLASQMLLRSSRLVNVYGPTETTIWSTFNFVQDAADTTIGRPLDNQWVFVLDQNGRLSPPYIPGELWIGGLGVSNGYLHDKPRTLERFVANKCTHSLEYLLHGRHTNSLIYRTGDVVRWNQSGKLEFLGRCDRQTKVNGFRVELEAVEAALSTCTGIHEVIVQIREVGQSSHLVRTTVRKAQTQRARRMLATSCPHTCVRLSMYP